MFHDMRCCVYVQAAPGGDLGCRVYVAGGTLVRREKREAKLCSPDCVFRLYDLFSYVLCHVCHGVFGGRLRYSRYAVRPYIGGMYHQFDIK